MAGGRDKNNFLKLVEAPGTVDNYFLFALDGEESFSQPFHHRLTVRSQGDIPAQAEWVGASITFTLSSSEGTERRINGQCVRFEHAYQKQGYVEFVLELAPSFAAAKLKRDHRIFTDKSPKDVVAQVLREHQVAFDDSKVTSSVKADYIVQNDETDFDFVNRLLESEGVFYYFRYDEGAGRYKHKMHLAEDTSGYYDGSPFELSFRRDHLLRGLVNLEIAYGAAPGSAAVHDYDFKHPGELTPATAPARIGWASAPGQVYAWSPGYADPAQGRRRAQLAMEGEESAAVVMRGTGSYAAFAPGARFQVDDPRLKPRERRIVVRSVKHDAFDPSGLAEGSPRYDQSFTAQPSAQVYRPPRRTSPAPAKGPQTAVVLDQQDPEGFGRVKVRFHWDRTGASSAWVRVLQQWAGGSIGSQFVPRPGMEVMIDFLNGDAASPVVVGCLFNGANKHPYPVPANLTQAGWRSQSYPEGGVIHEIMLEDKPGAEEVLISTGRDHRRLIKQDETAAVGRDHALAAGSSVSIDAGGALVLTSNATIVLQVGDSRVVVDAAGVSINGTLVDINNPAKKKPPIAAKVPALK